MGAMPFGPVAQEHRTHGRLRPARYYPASAAGCNSGISQ
jgi:hypothetical protein